MTDDRYQALLQRLDRLLIDLKADHHANALEKAVQLHAVLLSEIQLHEGLLGKIEDLQRRLEVLETPYRPRREPSL